MKLNPNQKAFLNLIRRSADVGEGWRKVSSTLWPLVEAFEHRELIETKDNCMVRLSEKGKTVLEYCA